MSGPLEWAGPPKSLSYSSLIAIETCPLQWQLSNSKYGEELDSFPARPAPAAVEGQIVHTVLDKLFKTLSLEGLPVFGTSEFRSCVEKVDIKSAVELLVAEHEDKILKHPRGNGFRLLSTRRQMINKVIRLFKNQYSQMITCGTQPIQLNFSVAYNHENGCVPKSNPMHLLETYGSLTEFYLQDEEISFGGILDLVWKDGDHTVIVDFKTGQKHENHVTQVSYYLFIS